MKTKWLWMYPDSEGPAQGPFNSIEATIENARQTLLENRQEGSEPIESDLAEIIIGEALKPDPAEFLPPFDSFLEDMDESAEGWYSGDDSLFIARSGAEAALKCWARRWLKASAYSLMNGRPVKEIMAERETTKE